MVYPIDVIPHVVEVLPMYIVLWCPSQHHAVGIASYEEIDGCEVGNGIVGGVGQRVVVGLGQLHAVGGGHIAWRSSGYSLLFNLLFRLRGGRNC